MTVSCDACLPVKQNTGRQQLADRETPSHQPHLRRFNGYVYMKLFPDGESERSPIECSSRKQLVRCDGARNLFGSIG